jgi:hypothetical protein
MNPVLDQLDAQPALAWKVAVNVRGLDPASPEAVQAALVTRRSALVASLLAEQGADGHIPHHPYKKWNGGHWVLASLADLGFPPGDVSLRPLLEDDLAWLFDPLHLKRSFRTLDGRVRHCASLEGNAIWFSLRLGLDDERTTQLVERLIAIQWPDGGWNCDKVPSADTSSFMETLIPLRAMVLYARQGENASVRSLAGEAARRAAEVFLSRRLFRRLRDGRVMDEHFTSLFYPPYWHYNILFGLKVLAEAGFLSDPRCGEALDLLESKRLTDGGFPAESTYSRPTKPDLSGYTLVDWGGTSRARSNPFVSADALYVLRMAGR